MDTLEARDYVLAMKKMGLTQTQISQGTAIPQPTISKIERGEIADVLSKSYRVIKQFHDSQKRKPKAQGNTNV